MLNDPSQYHQTLIRRLGIKNQKLIGAYLNLGLHREIASLKAVDSHLYQLLQTKMPASTHYIWRSQQDDKVRGSHAENNGRIFAWDNPPDTGHPGEDFNCRCWAEPINASEYANQLLITFVNDPEQWSNSDFVRHYKEGKGAGVTLSETGYLGDVIDHFANDVTTSDGSQGGYQAVNRQIIARAREIVEGPVDYSFSQTYEFGTYWHFIIGSGRYSLGHSTIIGNFDGDARKERVDGVEYLVITGAMNYEFKDEFTDPTSKVESLMDEGGISREEAIRRLGSATDEYGIPYDIRDHWQTKFNAVVKLKE